MSRSHRFQIVAIVAALVGLLAAFVGATAVAPSAMASTPGVQLSDDGTTFSTTYSGTLFDSTARMVPMSSQSGRFWVKNASGEPAYLRVSISDVTGGGTPFSSALTVSATSPGSTGSAVGVDAASPCYVLTQGLLLAPGAVARVDATLSLGDLTGLTGQTSGVGFDIVIGLSSAALGSQPPTSCPTNSGTVPGAGGGTGGGGTGGGSTGGGSTGGGHSGSGHGSTPATGAETGAAGNASGGVDTPQPDNGSAFEGDSSGVGILDANTGRFYQEWFVLLWILAAIGGGLTCWLVARRRTFDDEEVTRWADGAMSGRKAWSTTSGWA